MLGKEAHHCAVECNPIFFFTKAKVFTKFFIALFNIPTSFININNLFIVKFKICRYNRDEILFGFYKNNFEFTMFDNSQ